jgi:class 3 adenylate cyclase/pimeloyl-ACP methyl ester carboxylesterase
MAVRYARSGDLHLAYDTLGDGRLDILHSSSMLLSIGEVDGEPHVARYYRRLASFGRVIHFDPRGIGLSDPLDPSEPYTAAVAAADALAVLDAAGSDRAAVVAWSGAGPIALELAAAHPERVSALVLGDTYARLTATGGYPEGVDSDVIESFLRDNPDPSATWSLDGSDDVALLAPSLQDDLRFREWLLRASGRSASPSSARAYLRMAALADARDLLPRVDVPTLVVHRARCRFTPARLGRYLAAHVPGAKLVILPGADAMPWAGGDEVLDEVEEFLTGRRHGSADRVLTTLLFTDIVDSTRRAAALGDDRWRIELDTHDALVRAQLGRFGGREVNTTGDGFVAMFASPTLAVRCAGAIVEQASAAGLDVRAGLHTGECEQRGDDVAGVAVHIAARVAAHAGAREVLVTRTVHDVVIGSGLTLEPRGAHELKGVDGAWDLYAARL